VRISELEAWDTATRAIVNDIFGGDSAEAARWRLLTDRRVTIVGDAMRKDIKRGEYFGLIDYFHLAAGALVEFEAKYQRQQARPMPAPSRAVGALAEPAPPLEQAPLAPPAAPPVPSNGDRPPARAVDDGWELTIAVSDETYEWLAEAAIAREPAPDGEEAAAARLAATIVERVAANTRRKA
jgi:hypothetical protein